MCVLIRWGGQAGALTYGDAVYGYDGQVGGGEGEGMVGEGGGVFGSYEGW